MKTHSTSTGSLHSGNTQLLHMPRPWDLSLSAKDKLMLHFIVHKKELDSLLPPAFEADSFEGNFFATIILQSVNRTRFHDLPAFVQPPAYCEYRLRTYIVHAGTPCFYEVDIACNTFIAAMVMKRFSEFRCAAVKITHGENFYSYHDKKKDRHMRLAFEIKHTIEKAPFDRWSMDRFASVYRRNATIYRQPVDHSEDVCRRIVLTDPQINFRYNNFRVNADHVFHMLYTASCETAYWKPGIVSPGGTGPS